MQILGLSRVRIIIRYSRFLKRENKKATGQTVAFKKRSIENGPTFLLYTLAGDGVNHLTATDIKCSVLKEFLG